MVLSCVLIKLFLLITNLIESSQTLILFDNIISRFQVFQLTDTMTTYKDKRIIICHYLRKVYILFLESVKLYSAILFDYHMK